MQKNKEHNDMITQENQTDKKLGVGFNLAILKIKKKKKKKIHYERIEIYIIAT